MKFLFTLITLGLFASSVRSQTNTVAPTPEPAPKAANFDKKFRFGLRVNGQPTWFTSNEGNNLPSGVKFGAGFGLNMEFRLSEVVTVLTGAGGDFESGSYKFRNDGSGNSIYKVRYWQNNGGEFLEPKNGGFASTLENSTNTGYVLKERSIKTTMVTLPAILKLSTSEYSGFKYFGMFGLEVGIRIKTVAKDSYVESYSYSSTGSVTVTKDPPAQSNINLGKDASAIPLRVGLNAGIGAEYRLGGSTSFFFSFNYFRSFTNLLRKESKYMIYNIDNSNVANNYNYVKQNMILNAVRINVGIMF